MDRDGLRAEYGVAQQTIAELNRKLDRAMPLKPVRVVQNALVAADDAKKVAAERMAQMKPLFEGGMPIKGAVVVLVDGKPVLREVEFVIGKETRIESVDDGTYIVSPTLNADGSVRYELSLLKHAAEGGPESFEKLPSVIQFPWAGFTVGAGGGKVFAFDSDKSSELVLLR